MNASEATDGLYLGFDANCGTCSAVSSAVVDEIGADVVALPLEDPRMLEWRKIAFGPKPPHKPTLVRLSNGEPRAWTSVAIGTVLLGELGPRRTAKVLQALGIEREKAKSGELPGLRSQSLISRKGFMQLAGGAAAAVALFSSGSLVSAKSANAAERLPGGYMRDWATAAESEKLLNATLESKDLLTLLTRGDISMLRAADPVGWPAGFQKSKGLLLRVDESSETLIDGKTVQGTYIHIGHVVTTAPSGDRHISSFVQLPDRRMAWVEQRRSATQNVSAKGVLMQLPAANTETSEVLSSTYEGVLSEPIYASRGQSTTAAGDSCGGCLSNHMMEGVGCVASDVMGCVLQSIGCAACAVACAETWGLTCIGCAAGFCASAIRTCCARAGKPQCVYCGGGGA